MQQTLSRWISILLEGWCYLLVVAAPWFFGCGDITYAIGLYLGLSVLVILAVIKGFVEPFSWKLSPGFLLLALLFSICCLQIIPWSDGQLKWISPTTSKSYSQFLPAEMELPADGKQVDVDQRLGHTLSVYPGATRIKLLEVLAVLVLFGVVRFAIASPEALLRFTWVLVANATALSVQGIFQKFNYPENMIYGNPNWRVEGALVFGPFVNRNHFSSYVNFAVCMGLGLFLMLLTRKRKGYQVEETGLKGIGSLVQTWSGILQDPVAVWLVIPLGTMLAAVAISLSRSGMLSAAIGLMTVLVILSRVAPRKGILSLSLFIIILGLGVVLWLGISETIKRFNGELLIKEDLRWTLLKTSWELFRQYPIFGTGLGTFSFVEPRYRPAELDQNSTTMHAHNEYAEALVEGGLIRFVITLLIILSILFSGVRGIYRNRNEAWLPIYVGAFGAFLGFTIQSFFEFGIHLPAVTFVVVVVMGLLSGIAENNSERKKPMWLTQIVAAVIALTLASGIAMTAWNWYRSESLRTQAIEQLKKARNVEDVENGINTLTKSIEFQPEFQRTRLDWIRATQQLLDGRQRILQELDFAMNRTSLVSELTGLCASTPVEVISRMSALAASRSWAKSGAQSRELEYASKQIAELQRQAVIVRNLCPLVAGPHLEIAKLVVPPGQKSDTSRYKKADQKAIYLDRARELLPNHADTWFQAGLQEWLDGSKPLAMRSFRRALELDERHLVPILDLIAAPEDLMTLTSRKLEPAEIRAVRDQLLPGNKPSLLVVMAMRLFPLRAQIEERRPFLEEAQKMLELQADLKNPEQLHLQGLIHWGLNKPETAQHFLKDAIRSRLAPSAWFVDLARLYVEINKLSEANEVLRAALDRDGSLIEARLLLEQIEKMKKETESLRKP